MDKKIVIGVAGVIAVGAMFFAYSFYSASRIEAKFREALDPPAAECFPTGIVNKIDEYKRSMMASTATTSHTLKQLQGVVPPLVIDHQISHYPSLSGAFKVTSRIRVPDEITKEFKELGQEIPPIEITVYGNGRYEGSWAMPDMNNLSPPKGGPEKFTLNGLRLDFAQAETFKAALSLGKMLVVDPKFNLSLAGISYELEMKDSPHCLTHLDGQVTFKLADLSGDSENAKTSHKNIIVNAVVAEKSDDLTLKYAVKMDKVGFESEKTGEFALNDAAFELTLDKLSKTGYLNMAKRLNEIPLLSATKDPYMMGRMMGQMLAINMMSSLPELIKNSPSVELNKLAFTIDMSKPKINGSFLTTGKLTFDADGFDIGQLKTNPSAQIMDRIRFEWQGEISKSLLSSIPKQSQSGLQSLIAKDFINEEGDLYKTKASFEKGVFLLNGKPFDAAEFAAITADGGNSGIDEDNDDDDTAD